MSVQIIAPGNIVTTGAASAGATVPLSTSGQLPKFVRIAATAAAYVRFGSGAQTAVAGDMLIQPGDSQIIATQGRDQYAAIQVTAAGIVQVSPVEDI